MTPVPMRRQDARMLLVRANALLHRRAEVLAEFEAQTIREAHDRVVLNGGALSPAERQVIEAALEAMVMAGRQDLTDQGQAA